MKAAKKKRYIDPVCGSVFKLDQSLVTLRFQFREYHFCSEGCLDKFERRPWKYIRMRSAEESRQVNQSEVSLKPPTDLYL